MKLAMPVRRNSAQVMPPIPVTEVRKPDAQTGHQTAIITTAQDGLGNMAIASRMFARWCQENFFSLHDATLRYRWSYWYGAESIPGTLSLSTRRSTTWTKRSRKPGNSSGNSRQNWLSKPWGIAMKVRKKPNVSKLSRPCQTELQRLRTERKRHQKVTSIACPKPSDQPSYYR